LIVLSEVLPPPRSPAAPKPSLRNPPTKDPTRVENTPYTFCSAAFNENGPPLPAPPSPVCPYVGINGVFRTPRL